MFGSKAKDSSSLPSGGGGVEGHEAESEDEKGPPPLIESTSHKNTPGQPTKKKGKEMGKAAVDMELEEPSIVKKKN